MGIFQAFDTAAVDHVECPCKKCNTQLRLTYTRVSIPAPNSLTCPNQTTYNLSWPNCSMFSNPIWLVRTEHDTSTPLVTKSTVSLLLIVCHILSLLTCRTPSQVWIPSLDFTGIVPSPDSIFVRNCPRAFLFGCLSMESSCVTASWGEKILQTNG